MRETAAGEYGHLLDAVRGLSWPARRVAPRGPAGRHHSRLLGFAPELSEYRAYRQGDDPRRLAWKLLARTDRAYLHLSDDHATLATWILVDASASMAFPSGSLAKWITARQVAVGLAAVVHRDGDPVALRVSGRQRSATAASTRRGVVRDAIALLQAVEPAGDGPLAPALREAVAARAARVVIVSDFLGDADRLLPLARERIAAGLEVHAVQVVAREELDPPGRGFLAVDPERPDLRRSLSAETRAGYERSFAAWRAALAVAWRGTGAALTEVVTDEPPAHAVGRTVGAAG
jgi:uncharacterized protein (DUF58 family)